MIPDEQVLRLVPGWQALKLPLKEWIFEMPLKERFGWGVLTLAGIKISTEGLDCCCQIGRLWTCH